MEQTQERMRKVKNQISEINRYRRIYGDKIDAMERLPILKEELKELKRRLKEEK